MDGNHLLGPAEVAKLIGVTAMTVRRISDKGELPFNVTPGGHRRYKKGDVLSYCSRKDIELSDNQTSAIRVMIVDDDKQVVLLLKTFLESFELEIQTELAYGGFEAGLKVKDFQPDIIISDIRMPDLSGTEMLKNLKRAPSTKNIRVIGITGLSDESEIQSFLAAGAESCLQKPIKRKELFEALKLK